MTLPIALALGVALAVGFLGARWFQQQARKAPGEGAPVERESVCGEWIEFGPFATPAAGASCKVLVDLRESCTERCEIEVENAQGSYERIRETAPGDADAWLEDADPAVPAAVVVDVPRGRKLRLRCPRPEVPDPDRKCKVAVADLTRQPTRAIEIRRETRPPQCRTWTLARVVNLSTRPLSVKINYLQVCTDASGIRQPVEWRMVAARRVQPPRKAANSVPAAGTGTTSASIVLDAGYALEVRCTGDRGDCMAKVLVTA